MDNPGEILRLCRLCLVKDQVNIPIFEEQGDIRQTFLKIRSCLPVKVSRDDKLPKKICGGCSNKLDLFYEFWSSTANSEKTLQSWLGQEEEDDKMQEITKPVEALVKEESEALEDGHAHDQSFDEATKDEAEAPPAKRARRTAAVKAQINISHDSDEDEDVDGAEPITKIEDESDDSDGEEKDPSYTEVPGTSADDQAGPSGLGKDGVEAPFHEMSFKEQQSYLKHHFSKNCTIVLVDILKCPNKKPIVKKKRKKHFAASPDLPAENVGRKKYSCYICFEKFSTEGDLDLHKLIHNDDEDEEDEARCKSYEKDIAYQVVDESASESDEESSETTVRKLRSFVKPVDNVSSLIKNPSIIREALMDLIDEVNADGAQKVKPTEESGQIKEDSSNKDGEDYKCVTCNIFFANQMDIKAHVHNQYVCKYFCRRCTRQFNTKGGFIVHVLQHGTDSSLKFGYKCAKCSASFDDCYQLKKHYVAVHNVFSKAKSEEEASANIAKAADSDPKSSGDPSNPVTGYIPIYDCDVCYDVFATKKALHRHKKFHEKLDKMKTSPICIEDDDVQVVQKDAYTTPHEVVSNFTTVRKTQKFVPIKPAISAAVAGPSGNASTTSFNKTEVTSQITQMLGGTKIVNTTTANSSLLKTRLLKKVSNPLTSSSSLVLNHPPLSAPGQPAMLSLPGLDPSKTYYVLLPSQDPSQTPSMIPIAPTSATASTTTTCPPMVPLATSSSSIGRVIPASVVPKPSTLTKTKQNIIPSMSVPIISNVETCQQTIPGSSNEGSFVMPVITSFGTVTDDVASKKMRKDPASHFENEYARFLKEGANEKKKKIFIKEKIPLGSPPAIKQDMKNQVVASDPITIEDEGNSVTFTELTNVPFDVSQNTTSSELADSAGNWNKPKIFVRKMADLI
ncbi:uncharacterized protein [Euwallacea similis]|uniref:uncharacterized protein isoform X1 n=1 Tax=Euwallacea similis TaxID=1736056 RepID=UPI003450DF62